MKADYRQSAKSAARGHRTRPSGNQGSESGQSQSPGPASGKLGGPNTQPGSSGIAPPGPDMSRRADDSTHRRARVESMTLGDPSVAEVDELLDALQQHRPHATPDALPPRRAIRRVNAQLAEPRPPLSRSNTVTSDARSITPSPLLPYLSPADTPSVDSASTIGPVTPEMQVDALRRSIDSMCLGSREPSANEPLYGLGLPSIPQEPNELSLSFRADANIGSKRHAQLASAKLTRSASISRPPAAPSGYQAQFIVRRREQAHGDLKVERASIDTRSSFSQSDAGQSEWAPATPNTPDWGDPVDVHLAASRHNSRPASSMLSPDSMSISSGSTGTSSKKAMKAERKM